MSDGAGDGSLDQDLVHSNEGVASVCRGKDGGELQTQVLNLL